MKKTPAEGIAATRKKLLEFDQMAKHGPPGQPRKEHPTKVLQALLIDIGYEAVDTFEEDNSVTADNAHDVGCYFVIGKDGDVDLSVNGYKDSINVGSMGNINEPGGILIQSLRDCYEDINDDWFAEHDKGDPNHED